MESNILYKEEIQAQIRQDAEALAVWNSILENEEKFAFRLEEEVCISSSDELIQNCKEFKEMMDNLERDDATYYQLLKEILLFKVQNEQLRVNLIGNLIAERLESWKENEQKGVELFQLHKYLEEFVDVPGKPALLQALQALYDELQRKYKGLSDIIQMNILEEVPEMKTFGSQIMKLEFQAMKMCQELGFRPEDAKDQILQDQEMQKNPTAKKLLELFETIIESNQPEESGEVEQARLLYELVKDMPLSAEQVLFKLLYLIEQNLSNQQLQKDEGGSEVIIQLLLNQLTILLQNDGKESNHLYNMAKTLSFTDNSQNALKALKDQVIRIKLELIQFNFKEFMHLYDLSAKAAEQIEGKDIILLLGATGTGKSTCIHYLAGSEMYRTLVRGLNHIAFRKVKNEELKKVKVSPFSKSETRFVKQIQGNLKDLGDSKDQSFIILDTPGCEDTMSHEVDLSNSLGIIKAIHGTKSIIPVIIFSEKNFGTRGQALKKNINYYARMIKNAAEDIVYFNYVISHFPESGESEKDHESLSSRLIDIRDQQNELEKSDEVFNAILDDIIEKAQDRKVKIMRPLDNKPLTYMRNLIKSKPIKTPKQTFQLSLTTESIRKVQDQIIRHNSSIVKALIKGETELALSLYKDIERFVKIFQNNESFKQLFEQTSKNVINLIEDNYKSAQNCLKNWFKEHFDSSLNDESNFYIDEYQKYIEKAKPLENFRCQIFSHLDLQVKNLDDFLNLGRTIVNLKLDKLKQKNIYDPKWQLLIRKAYLLKKKFKQSQYQSLDTQIIEVFQQKLGQIEYQCFQIIEDLAIIRYEQEQQYEPDTQRMDQVMQRADLEGVERMIDLEEPQSRSLDSLDKSLKSLVKNLETLRTAQQMNGNNDMLKHQIQNAFNNINKNIQAKIKRIQRQELNFIQFNSNQDNEEQKQSIPSLQRENSANSTGSQRGNFNIIKFESLNDEKIEYQIQGIQSYLDLLSNFSSMLKDQGLNETLNVILTFKRQLEKILKQQFQTQFTEINQALMNEKKYFMIEILYKDLKLLNRIHYVKQQNSAQFQLLNNNLFTIVHQQSEIIQNMIKNDSEAKINERNLKRLKNAVKGLNSLNWISDENKLFYIKIKGIIQNQLETLQEEIKDQSKQLNLDIQGYQNFEEVKQIIKNLDDIQEIGQALGFNLESVDCQQNWAGQIKKAITQIQKYLNEQAKNPEEITILRKDIVKLSQFTNYILKLENQRTFIDQLLRIQLRQQEEDQKEEFFHQDQNEEEQQIDQEEMIKQLKPEFDLQQIIEDFKYFVCKQGQLIQKTVTFMLETQVLPDPSSQQQQSNQSTAFQDQINEESKRVGKIISTIQEILIISSTINKSFENLKSLFDENGDIESNIYRQAQNLLDSLVNSLRTSKANNNLPQYIVYINILKELRSLDKYIFGDDHKIEKLYQTFLSQESQTQNLQMLNFEQNLETGNYDKINEILFQFENIQTPEAISNFGAFKEKLQTKCRQAITQLKKLVLTLDEDSVEQIDASSIDELAAKLINIKMRVRGIYIDLQVNEVKRLLIELITSLTIKIQQSITKIKDFNRLQRFNNSALLLKNTRLFIKRFSFINEIPSEQDCSEQNDQHYTQIKFLQELKDQYIETKKMFSQIEEQSAQNINEISDKINKAQSIEELQKLRPKQLIQILTKDSNASQDYEIQLFVATVNQHINNVYDNFIVVGTSLINEQKIDSAFIQTLEGYLYSLAFMPENIEIEFKHRITELIQQAKKQSENQIKLIQNHIQSDNIKNLNKALNEAKFKPSDAQKQQIYNYFEEKIDSVTQKVNKFSKEAGFVDDFQQILDILLNPLVNQSTLLTNKITSLQTVMSTKLEDILIDISNLFVEDLMVKVDNKKSKELALQLVQFLYFRHKYGDQALDYLPDLDKSLEETMEKGVNSQKKNKELFEQSLKSQPILVKDTCQSILNNRKLKDFVYELREMNSDPQSIFKNFSQKWASVKGVCEKIEIIIREFNYEQCCKTVNLKFLEMQDNIKNEKSLINEKTKFNAENRKIYYQNLQFFFDFVSDIKSIKEDMEVITHLNVEEQEKQTFNHVQNILIKELDTDQSQINKIIEEGNPMHLERVGFCQMNLESIQEYCPHFAKIAQRQNAKIEEGIKDTIYKIGQEAKKEENIKNVNFISSKLINLQKIKIHSKITKFETEIEQQVNDVLKTFTEKNKDGMAYNKITNLLNESTEGSNLVSSNSFFKGIETALFNKKIQSFSITTVLEQIRGDYLDKKALEDYYKSVMIEYKEQVKLNLKDNMDLSSLINGINSLSRVYQGKKIEKPQMDGIPQLMGKVFALWTLMRAESYFKLRDSLAASGESQQEQQFYLLQPHAAQVVSILRILCLGFENGKYNKPTRPFHPIKQQQYQLINNKMFDNFVQIKTGEGKSVTLAVVSIIFALFGFDVSSACYSAYLSQRDYNDFKDIFEKLNVQDSIFYGTFNQICERFINNNGSVRDMILNRILVNHPCTIIQSQNQKPKVLLVDEVDVFFSKDFYNQAYCPLAQIQSPQVIALLDYFWSNKDTKLVYRNVLQTPQYLNCKALFKPEYQKLLEETVKNLMFDLKEFMNHQWIIHDQKIGYKDQDQISFRMRFGYKTLFAHYYEASKGRISQQTLNECKSITIDCSEFSYSEIPNYFCLTLGVTGTLDALSKNEQSIVQDVFQILNFTFSPSVYGQNNLYWTANPRRIMIESTKELFYSQIANNLKDNLEGANGSRAVVIFFESQAKLDDFFKSPQFESYQKTCQILNEKLTDKEKSQTVTTATYPQRVTLSTRSFGRGTDFICKDREVELNGGVHVIQTFLSELQTEFVQIQGRTARQGNKGSFVLILYSEDLKSFDIEKHETDAIPGDKLEFLTLKRDKMVQSLQKNDTKALEQLLKMHNLSFKIKDYLVNKQETPAINKEIFDFLFQQNRGPAVETIPVKTLVLMDATGSMSGMINKTKNSVGIMFERAQIILKENGIEEDSFLIQFAAYRSYNSSYADLLEHSAWESKAINLRSFMDKCTARGGWSEEAAEVALQHANYEADNNNGVPLKQVFLIGDAPPTPIAEVKNRRNQAILNGTKFQQPTDYIQESRKLKGKGIPVYTFYVANWAKPSFEEIASISSTKCQFLDVNNEAIGQKMLIDMFVQQILSIIGDSPEMSMKLVESYKKRFT